VNFLDQWNKPDQNSQSIQRNSSLWPQPQYNYPLVSSSLQGFLEEGALFPVRRLPMYSALVASRCRPARQLFVWVWSRIRCDQLTARDCLRWTGRGCLWNCRPGFRRVVFQRPSLPTRPAFNIVQELKGCFSKTYQNLPDLPRRAPYFTYME